MSIEQRYKVTALKWRPQKFKDVVFQTHITTTLTNAIKSGRIAHAYLFCGPRGVGKTTVARIFSRAVNCLNPQEGEPCDECENCKLALQGRGLDIVEIDGASNRGIDDMRNLQESARYTPSKGKYKVFIIDEIHMITREGFNAFLKTLEEPPEHIIFIGATTEPIKVYPTIISRCQRFDFRRIPVKDIIERLKFISQEENISMDEDSLLTIAKKGDGSLRDAQSIFDQVVSSCGNIVSFDKILRIMNLVPMDYFFRIDELIIEKNTKGGLELVDEIIRQGYDLHEFIIGLLDHLRNLLLTVVTKSSGEIDVSEEQKKKYIDDSEKFTEGDVIRIMKLLADIEINYKYFNQPRLRFEVALLQVIKMSRTIEITNLLQEIEELKKKLTNQSINYSPQYSQVKTASAVAAGKEQSYKFKTPPSDESILNNLRSINRENKIPISEIEKGRSQDESANLENTGGLNSGISLDVIKQEWNVLLEEIMKYNKISIRSILSTVQLLSFDKNILTIACPNELNVDIINNNKNFLLERIEAVYKARFNLNPFHSTSQTVHVSNSIPDGNKNINERDSIEKNHPIIQTLMKELGAEPVV